MQRRTHADNQVVGVRKAIRSLRCRRCQHRVTGDAQLLRRGLRCARRLLSRCRRRPHQQAARCQSCQQAGGRACEALPLLLAGLGAGGAGLQGAFEWPLGSEGQGPADQRLKRARLAKGEGGGLHCAASRCAEA